MHRVIVVFLLMAAASAASAQSFLGFGDIVAERAESDISSPGDFGFGQSAVRFDDQLIVGATGEYDSVGAVIFFRREAGIWTEFQRIEPDIALGPGEFGYALTLANDQLVVGAPGAGQVLILDYDGVLDRWVPVQVIEEPTPAAQANFGRALTFANQTIFIGAPYADPTQLHRGEPTEVGSLGGRVYAYQYDTTADEWALVQTIAGEQDVSFAGFGAVLEADGNRLVVGAIGEADGAVYAYSLGDDDAKLFSRVASPDLGLDTESQFGRSLSLVGDRLLVGAAGEFDFDVDYPGRAYVLDFTDDGIEVTASFGRELPQFGWSVQLLGENQALVGAPLNGGSVTHFIEDTNGWSSVQHIFEPGQSSFSDGYFGETMMLVDGELLIGAPSALHHWGISGGGIPLPSFSQGGKLYEIPLVGPPLADLSLTVPPPAQSLAGRAVEFTFRVRGDVIEPAAAAFIMLRTYMDLSPMPDSCIAIRDGTLRCELGGVPANGTVDFTVSFVAPQTFGFNTGIQAYVGSELADPDSSDNAGKSHIEIIELTLPGPGGDGGGGTLGWLSVLFLLVMLEFRLRQTGACDVQPRPAHRRV